MSGNYHYSVMLDEVITNLDIKTDGIYLDLTLGRAGHSKQILRKIPNGLLIGVDQDIEAIEYSKEELKKIGSNFKVIKDNFRNIKSIMSSLNITAVDGVLYDLGVSSPQFDKGERGFSYRYDATLDMRMDLDQSLNAKEIVNTYPFKELVRVFKNYGEEKYAYQIANQIVLRRQQKEISSTFDLVDIIKSAKPTKELSKIGHPAKQVFQALRIEVNDELNALATSLEDSINLLKIKGRVVVISFHSLEDRIVKNIFKKYSVIEGNRTNDLIDPRSIEQPSFKLVNKKVMTPTDEEINFNYRSKSAKLRVLEKVK